MDFRCPGCDSTLRVPVGRAGLAMRCPLCGALATVPEAGAPGDVPGEGGAGAAPVPYVPPPAPDLAALDGGGAGGPGGEAAGDPGGEALASPEVGGAPDLSGLDGGGGAGVKLACPSCGQSLGVPRSYAGMLLKCPACSSPFTAPGDDAPQWDAFLVPAPGAPHWTEPEYVAQPPTEDAVATAAALNEQSDRASASASARGAGGGPPAGLVEAGAGVEAPPDFADDEGALARAEAARDEWSRDVRRQGLERKLEGLGPQVEEARQARGERNSERRGAAQRRLRGRAAGMLPGGGALAGLESLADDIAEAVGLRDEGEGDRERELVAEARKTNELLEELLRSQVNDGASLAERNAGEDESRGARRRDKDEASPSAGPSRGRGTQGSPTVLGDVLRGALRPSMPVAPAGGAGAGAPGGLRGAAGGLLSRLTRGLL